MNTNDIYKLKYYKYKNKYLQLKNRYNQEGGATSYFVFFFNREELEKKNGIIFRNKIDDSGVEFVQKNKGVKQVQNYIPTKSKLSNLSSLKAMIQHDETIEQAYFYNEDKSLGKKKCKLLNDDEDSKKKLYYDYNREDFRRPFGEEKQNIFNFFSIIDKCLTPNEPKVDFFIVISVSKFIFSLNSNFVYWGIERKLPGVNTNQSGSPTDKISGKQDLLPQELRKESPKPIVQNQQSKTNRPKPYQIN